MEIVDDLAALIRRLEEVEKKQAALQAERDHYRALYLEMLERCRKKPTGRKPLPDHLPRVDIEVLPEEVQREGLDAC